MIIKPLYKNFTIILAADLFLLTGALYAAHLIRFDFDVPPYFLASFYRMLPYVLIAKIACFYYFDLYRGMWRYTSIADMLNIIKASTLGQAGGRAPSLGSGEIAGLAETLNRMLDVTEAQRERITTLVANVPGAVYRCTTDDPPEMLFMSQAISATLTAKDTIIRNQRCQPPALARKLKAAPLL